jgi:beta-lysine 5,6-aminomutase alpha subunit
VITGQGIHLAGILTEAIHTPLMQDRHQSLCSINYVFNVARELGAEIEFRRDGFIQKRARQVLDEADQFMLELKEIGLMEAIAQEKFANISRPVDGGKGLEGVFEKGSDYSNPVMEQLEHEGIIHE